MEVTDHKPETDITQEPYKGPGAFVTGAGEGAVAHYGTAFGGLFLGGALTYLFHGAAAPRFEALRKNALQWMKSENAFTRFSGKFASNVLGVGEGALAHEPELLKQVTDKAIHTREHGFGLWLLEHTIGLIPPIGRKLRNVSDRTTTAFGVGGIAGFFGFFVAPLYFMFTGAKHANQGRDQFERAKSELIDAHTENEALRQRYIDAKLELEDIKTTRAAANGELRVAKDNPVVVSDDANVAKDSPNVVSSPRIDAPTIGTSLPQSPKIEGPPVQGPSPQSPIPRNQWWDGKEQPVHTVAAQDAVAERVQHEAALTEAR